MWTILTVLAAALVAQAPLHDAQYPDADIAYGAKLYVEKCVTCHGPQGDAIGGVNLRSGKFRNAVIDRDLERFIRAGSPAGMPAFTLDNAEMAGIIAYLRNMNAFDSATVKAGDAARGRSYAAELVALAPDVILASASPAVLALQETTRTVPIVFAQVIDPVGAGFVESLARPGGNTTGFTQFEYGMSGKWLELLKEIAPRVTRVAVIRDPALASGAGQLGLSNLLRRHSEWS